MIKNRKKCDAKKFLGWNFIANVPPTKLIQPTEKSDTTTNLCTALELSDIYAKSFEAENMQ